MKNKFTKKYSLPILEPSGNPYIYYKGNWEGRWVYHPKVIEKDGKYFLFYSGKSGVNLVGNIRFQMRQDIGLAISSDLTHWVRYEDNPILSPGQTVGSWDNDLVCHGYILKEDKYYMFYDGSSKSEWKESIGLAVSSNLLDWKKNIENPVLKCGSFWWDKKHVSRCCVIKKGKDNYYMYFAGHDGTCERIGVARSKNLVKWDKFIKEPVINLGEKGSWDERFVSDPTVIKVNDYYLMTYTGYKNNIGCTGLAFSRDLINWKKFPENPILMPEGRNHWDQDEAARSDIVKIDQDYHLFYTGRKGFFYYIGYAKVDIKKIMKIIQATK